MENLARARARLAQLRARARQQQQEAQQQRQRTTLQEGLLRDWTAPRGHCTTPGLVPFVREVAALVRQLRGNDDASVKVCWPVDGPESLKQSLLQLRAVRDDRSQHSNKGVLAMLFRWGLSKEIAEGLCRKAELPDWSFVAFVEAVMYDEAVFQLRVRKTPSQPLVKPVVSKHKAAGAAFPSRVKSLQSQCCHGFLVCHGPSDRMESYLLLVLPMTSYLQHLSATSSQVMYQALAEASCVSRMHLAAETFVRVANIDRARSNVQAERWLLAGRREACGATVSPGTLQSLCHLHMDAKTHSDSLRFTQAAVSGMVNISMSLQLSGDSTRFQTCLAEVIAARIVVIVGYPGDDAERHRQHVLDMFSRGPEATLQKQLLNSTLPSGRWWKTDVVEIWMPQGLPDGTCLQQWKKKKGEALASTLLPGTFHVYPRHRWTGAEKAVSEVALLACFHDVLTPTWWEFSVARLGLPRAMRVRDTMRQQGIGIDADVEACAAGAAVEDPERDDGAAVDDGGGDEGAAAQAFGSFSRKNKAYVANGLAWLSLQQPSTVTQAVLVQNVISILQRLLRRHLVLCSREWELQERAKAARHSKSGGSGWGRDFPVLVAARGTEESDSLRRLKVLLQSPSLWSLLPVSDQNTQVGAVALRMIATAGSQLERLQAQAHNRAPFALFQVLDGMPADRLEAIPDCCLDRWSSAFRRQNPRLSSAATRAKLLLVAMEFALGTQAAERGHAMIKRRADKRVHSHRQAFEQASASFALKRACGAQEGPPAKAPRAAAAQEEAERGPKRTRCGGPWRAFLRAHHSNDLAAAAVAYRAGPISEEIKQAGQAAKERGLDGVRGNAFGATAKQVQRMLLKDRLQHIAEQAVAAGATGHAQIARFVADACDVGMASVDVAAGVRLQRRILLSQASEARQRDARDIADFAATHTHEFSQELQPELSSHVVAAMEAIPLAGARVLQVSQRLTAQEAADVAAWMSTPAARYTQLPGGLSSAWQHSCRQLTGEQPPEEVLRRELQETVCFKLGRCVCSAEGQRQYLFRNSIFRALKARFSQKIDAHSTDVVICEPRGAPRSAQEALCR